MPEDIVVVADLVDLLRTTQGAADLDGWQRCYTVEGKF